MAKAKSLYICTECGSTQPKWQGQCPDCQAWNTLVETVAEKPAANGHRFASLAPASGVQTLGKVEAREAPRLTSGIDEFDRVLGGGLVSGGVVLIGGDPGIGKSTLLLQCLASLAVTAPVLYVSGEESAEQIALRAQRLEVSAPDLPLYAEINLEKILKTLEARQPRVAVIDSIQTLWSDALTSAPGSVAQVRECAAQLTRFAKQTGITLLFVGHVTKDGTLAGPRVLEHIVDTVLYFEGDSHSSFRLVRAVKNRYGSVNELGVFAMTDRGLRAVTNPSALFLSRHPEPVPGSSIVVTQEGTRPLLVEVQALVDQASAGHPKRLTVGLESQRLSMLLAVLHRHVGIMVGDQDVYVNAVGGVRINEPAADLAVILSILSSFKNKPLNDKLCVFGEVGLTGELRPCPRGQERLKEAAKLGFSQALVPAANAPKTPIPGLEVIAVRRLEEAVGKAFGL